MGGGRGAGRRRDSSAPGSRGPPHSLLGCSLPEAQIRGLKVMEGILFPPYSSGLKEAFCLASQVSESVCVCGGVCLRRTCRSPGSSSRGMTCCPVLKHEGGPIVKRGLAHPLTLRPA